MRRASILSVAALVVAAVAAGCVSKRNTVTVGSGDRTGTTSIMGIEGSSPAHIGLRTRDDISISRDTLAVPAADAWAALPGVYRELGVPIQGRGRDKMILGNTGFKAYRDLGGERLSAYIRCGMNISGSMADQYEIRMAVLTQLEDLGDRTAVHSHVDASAKPQSVMGDVVNCTTVGRLEERIVQLLRKHIADRAAGG